MATIWCKWQISDNGANGENGAIATNRGHRQTTLRVHCNQ